MTADLREQLRAVDLESDRLLPDGTSAGLQVSEVGAVVAGSLVAFGEGVSEQHRRDVQQCLLFAQLAAGAKADRHRQWTDWAKQYQSVLESTGWVVGTSSTASQWPPPGPFVLSTPVVDLFDERAGQEAKLLVTEALTAFRTDVDGPAQFLFECPSHAGSLGNFQVALATEDDDGDVRLRVGRFMFQSPAHVGRLALEQLPASTKLYAGYLDAVASERVLAAGRATIASRLGDRYAAQVAPLRRPRVPDLDELGTGLQDLGYDPADPFGDDARDGGPAASPREASRAWYVPPPVVESVLVDEPGARILLREELTVDPDHLHLVLETPSWMTWWKSVTVHAVRVPPGQDPRQFATNVQFLVQRVQPGGLVEDGAAALADPNAHLLGRIETKDATHQATFRVDPWMLDGNELHLEFHKGGFLGLPAQIPVEFVLRGGLGSQYTFRWERD